MGSRTFGGLDLVYSLEVSEPELRAVLYDLFECCSSSAPPQVRFAIVSDRSEHVVCVDDEILVRTDATEFAVATLVWEINRRVIASAAVGWVLVHAAAVQRGGVAMMLPGPSGSGKSTLAASLLAAGYGYLTDDVVAIDATGRIVPYPKPLGLGEDVVPMFAALSDAPPAATSSDGERYVSPTALGACASDAAPRLVLFPTYDAAGSDRLVAISRAETLVRLAESSFNFATRGQDAFETLARVIDVCECYRIEYAHADRVVAFVDDWYRRSDACAAV
jgi:hypothetical protein